MSFAKLQQKIDQLHNPTVVGLDPALESIPPQLLDKYIKEHGETLAAAALAVIEYNLNLIDALSDIVPAVKPQLAYYEQLGSYGMYALKLTCHFAKTRGMYVIFDGKRGDIGATSAAYSAAYLGNVTVGETELKPYDADALTINAYLGSDGIAPFIETARELDKALFALVRTSNPSAGELQDKCICHFESSDESCPLYAAVGDLIEKLSLDGDDLDEYGYTRVGAVVGATYPGELKMLRERLNHTFFLVPGYGVQGGTAEDARHAFDLNGRGAIISSSRAIIAAWKKSDPYSGIGYADAARFEAIKMREELRKTLTNVY